MSAKIFSQFHHLETIATSLLSLGDRGPPDECHSVTDVYPYYADCAQFRVNQELRIVVLGTFIRVVLIVRSPVMSRLEKHATPDVMVSLPGCVSEW
ncbi:hypothetical protein LJR238_003508 [Pararhizobium sp. LjRoot238]